MASRFVKGSVRAKKLSGVKTKMKKGTGGNMGSTEFKTQKNKTPKESVVGKKAGNISDKGSKRNSTKGGTTGM